MNTPLLLKHNYHLFNHKNLILQNRFTLPVTNQSQSIQLQFSCHQLHLQASPGLNHVHPQLNSFECNCKHETKISKKSVVINRFASNSMSLLNKQSQLELQLDLAQSQKNLIQILKIARELKQTKPIPQDQLRLTYRHLITILSHYGLWTQLYAIVNELFDSIPMHEIDDVLWSTILDGFVQCGKSADVILSLLLSSRDKIEKNAMSALFRSAILESNLSQSIYLLQISSKHDLIQSLDKNLLVQLACLFLEHNQVLIAIDLLHSFVLPITHSDHRDCVLLLISFLRKSVDQSDPQSTLYCYSYLAKHHSEITQELIEQDSGLMIQLLNLASRHLKPELTLNILSQLVMTNKKITSSSIREKKLGIQHLIPSIISLCRAGDNQMQAIKILISTNQEFPLMTQEIELIGFNMFLGHLGGLDQFRQLHNYKNQHNQSQTINEKEIEKRIQSLNQSEKICKTLIVDNPIFTKEKNSYLDQDKNKNNSRVLTCLINSLIQANLEMNRPERSIELFKSYFQNPFNQSTSVNQTQIQPDKTSAFELKSVDSFGFLQPDFFTLSLLKSASERISDSQIQLQISNFIDHFQQNQSA